MPIRSIVEVEVNSSEFQRFQSMFDNYTASLQSTPQAWQQASQHATATATATKNAAHATTASTAAMHNFIILQESAARQAGHQARSWNSMASNAGKFALHIADATRSLLRWGALTGLISGILGGGGLFGIERLAGAAAGQRASGFALGVKPGDVKAFETSLEPRGFDARGFLGNVNTGLHSISSDQRIGMGMLGVNTNTNDTSAAALETLTKLKSAVDKIPEAAFNEVAHAQKLDNLLSMEELRILKNTPQSEIAGVVGQIPKDRNAMSLTDQTTKGWLDLVEMLKRAGNTIENVLITKLVALSEPLAHLSESVTKAVTTFLSSDILKTGIEALAKGIEQLAGYLGSDEFKKDVQTFFGYVSTLGAIMKEAVDYMGGFTQIVSDLKKLFADEIDQDVRDFNEIVKLVTEGFKGLVDALTSVRNWFGGKGAGYSGPESNPDQRDNGIFGGSYSDPRGIRNNNPTNLSYVPGQGAQGSDGRFGVYQTMEDGIAAAERQLRKYKDQGYDTLSKIINRWAPSSENDSDSYIRALAGKTGIDPNAKVDVNDPKTASAIISEMIKRETGRYVDRSTVDAGVQRGLGGGAQLGSNQPGMVPNSGRPSQLTINVNNNTGANITYSSQQLALG